MALNSASDLDPVSAEQSRAVREHLRQVLASRAFAGSKRAQDFLELLVEHALAGRTDSLRERMIGAEMFGRPVDYDTANDAVVRVKASEVRRRLSQYYAELEEPPAIRIELPVGGYVPKFIWPAVQAMAATATGSTTALPSPVIALPIVRHRVRWSSSLLLGAAGLVLLLVAFIFAYKSRPGSPGAAVHTIAILPLLNLSGDARQDYFADGMTEELIAELGQVASLRVISRTSTMTYKGTKKTLPEIARELNVDDIVEGSIGRERNHIRITTQLIDTKTDQHVWAQTYDRDMTSVLDLQSEVASAIAAQISTTLTPVEKQRLSRSRHADPEAIDLYMQGIQLTYADDHKGAAALLQKSITKDPTYAQSHAALAFSYGRLGDMGWMPYGEAFSNERAEAMKAIELDDSRPEAHLQLGMAAMNQNWDFATTEKEFKRALELNANASAVHWAYATYLQRVGRVQKSLAEAKLAYQLDPVSSYSHAYLAYAFYYNRQYDEALAEVNKGVSSHAHQFLSGLIHAEKHQYDAAISDFKELGDAPHAIGHMANAMARSGREAEAHQGIERLKQHISESGIGRYEVAIVYAALKDNDDAFQYLEQALSVRDKGMTFLLIDPCLDALRPDPRFESLLRRVGFPLEQHP